MLTDMPIAYPYPSVIYTHIYIGLYVYVEVSFFINGSTSTCSP